jgi:alpha-tubulin suppressor-like RCC1 family protein
MVDDARRLLTCGEGAATGPGDPKGNTFLSTPLAAMAGVQVRSVAAGHEHSLALGCDGRVYSWGKNGYGQLGQGDTLDRPSPALLKGLEGICRITASCEHSLAVTRLGAVFSWGRALLSGMADLHRPVIVEGLEGVRILRVSSGTHAAFAIGEAGELFS